MRNKTAAIAAAAVLIGATAGVTLTASAAPRPPLPLTVVATTTHEALLVLNSTPRDPTGNQFVSAHDLYRGRHKIGADGASCQVIDVVGPERLRVQCVASLSLPAGQLTAQGLTVVDEAGTTPFTLAITGGTGAYASAHGQITVRPLNDQRSRYTITLQG
jgi:hypothetical protein